MSRHVVLAVIVALAAGPWTGPAGAASLSAGPWPMSSEHPVLPLPNPTLETHVRSLGSDLAGGFRFVAFGDQRALADGEWQAMIELIRDRETRVDPPAPLAAVIDTGDIVFDGRKSDQYLMLAEILAPLRAWPYLVAVGNHETWNNQPGPARANLARALGDCTGPGFDERRMYYRKDVGPVTLLFLDTNDLVYGPSGDRTDSPGLSYRGRRQLRWMVDELDEVGPDHTVVVVLHHPLVQSSSMHEAQGRKLWSLRYQDRTLPELLIDGGVDLILAGHTHIYERYRLVSPRGNSAQLINVSGRPRNDFLWFSKSKREGEAIAGRESEFLTSRGWMDLEGWSVDQFDVTEGDGADQWLELRVDPTGRLEGEVFFLSDEGRGGASSGGVFEIPTMSAR